MNGTENVLSQGDGIQTMVDAVRASPENKQTRDRILTKLYYQRLVAGPGTSILVHIVGLLLIMIMAVPDVPEPYDVGAVVLQPQAPPLEMEKIEKTPEPEVTPETEPEVPPEDSEMAVGPGTGPSYDPIVIGDASISDPTAMGSGGSVLDGTPGIGSGLGTEQGFEISVVSSPLTYKGLYAARTAGGRKGALTRYGGGGGGGGGFPSETAVLKALRWLKANQLESGAWAGPDPAMCGLALLCYMAHGETPGSKEFGATVEKAIRHLLYLQQADGKFSTPDSYSHAIATYALAESFGMTKMVMLKEPLEKAVQVIIDGQQPGGAFDYTYAKGARHDMSVTAWQVQALKAAKLAGAENAGLQPCLYKCLDGLKLFIGGNGTFGYSGPGGSTTLTGAGILCLQFLGKANDPAVQNALTATETLEPGWPTVGGGTYAWYYHTQARFQNGGPLWDKWNKIMLPMLTKNQKEDGHWEGCGTIAASPVFDTVLCCLCLEVYYRYLPTYDKVEEIARAPKTKDEADAKIAVQNTL